MTPNQFRSVTGCTAAKVSEHFAAALYAMTLFGLVGREVMAAFLANAAHETLGLFYSDEVWGPTAAQRRYEGPGDLARTLGNTVRGDGFLYRGRGPGQITGRANYRRATLELRKALGAMANRPIPLARVPDFEASPNAVSAPTWGWLLAAQYFVSRGCVERAEKGDFDGVCKIINGGVNGLADRRARYAVALKALA